MQGGVNAIFVDDRVDDDAVTGQALLDDPRRASGAEITPSSSHDRQARFSRFVTGTKYFAGSTSIGSPLRSQSLQFLCCSTAHALMRHAMYNSLGARKIRR